MIWHRPRFDQSRQLSADVFQRVEVLEACFYNYLCYLVSNTWFNCQTCWSRKGRVFLLRAQRNVNEISKMRRRLFEKIAVKSSFPLNSNIYCYQVILPELMFLSRSSTLTNKILRKMKNLRETSTHLSYHGLSATHILIHFHRVILSLVCEAFFTLLFIS